jgi:tRNA U38,U39,U40 pseudouridine synthase TruA
MKSFNIRVEFDSRKNQYYFRKETFENNKMTNHTSWQNGYSDLERTKETAVNIYGRDIVFIVC